MPQPQKIAEAKKFENFMPDKMTATSEKLRYYRYKKSLLQQEVADYAGISLTTYKVYESNLRSSFPLDKLSKIATLFEVDITELLDDYNTFIYKGQGRQIKELRKDLNLSQEEFAKFFCVHTGTVKKWENDKVQISKNTYDKLYDKSHVLPYTFENTNDF